MKRNGFTLIELLAVIVILAIIALIATPIILGIINDAREKANERSVELYASAVRNGIAAYQLREGKEVLPGTYNETNKLPFEVEYDGKVDCTSVVILEDGKVSLEGCTVNGGEKEYRYGPIQEEPICFSVTGNDLNYNYETEDGVGVTGTYNTGTKSIGDAYRCQVNDSESFIFNIIGKNGDNVDLMINYNIIDSAWNANVGLDETYLNIFNGPVSALSNLKSLTDTWTNIIERTDSTTQTASEANLPDTEKEYTINYTGYRARLPEYNEINTAQSSGSDYWYMSGLITDGRGQLTPTNSYWLLGHAEADESNSYSYYVGSLAFYGYGVTGFMGCNVDDLYQSSGIRPVITVPASKIK